MSGRIRPGSCKHRLLGKFQRLNVHLWQLSTYFLSQAEKRIDAKKHRVERGFSRGPKEAVALPLAPADAPCAPPSSGGIRATKLHNPHHLAGRPRLAASSVNVYPHLCREVQFLNLCERYTNGVPFR